MYNITLQTEYGTDRTKYTIYNDEIERGMNPATNIVWNQSTTNIDSLEFDIYDNPNTQAIIDGITMLSLRPFYSQLALRDNDFPDNAPLFAGRATSVSPQMDGDGTPYMHVVAEHEEACLNDCQIDNSEYIKEYCTDSDVFDGGKWRVNCSHYINWILAKFLNVMCDINDALYGESEYAHYCLPGTITITKGASQTITQKVGTPHELLLEVFQDRCGEWKFEHMTEHDYLAEYGQPSFTILTDTTDYTLVMHYTDGWFESATRGEFRIGLNIAQATYEANYNQMRNVIYPVGDEYETGYEQTTLNQTFKEALPLSVYYDAAASTTLDKIASLGFEFSDDHNFVFHPLSVDKYGVVSERYQITGFSTKTTTTPETSSSESSSSESSSSESSSSESSSSESSSSESEEPEEETCITVNPEQADAFFSTLYNHLLDVMDPEETYDITAYDLSQADNAPSGWYNEFKLYEWWVPDISEIAHRPIQTTREIVELTTYIQEPHKSRVQLGKPRKNSLRILAQTANTATTTAQKVEKLETEKLSREPATKTNLGGIKTDGTSVDTSASGVLSVRPASSTNLGGVMADGSTTTIDDDGTIHAAGALVSHTVRVHANCQYTGAQTTDGVPNSASFVTTGDQAGFSFETKINLTQLKQLVGVNGSAIVRVVGIEDRHDYNTGYMAPKSFMALVKRTSITGDVMTIHYSMMCAAPYNSSSTVTGTQSHFIIQLAVDAIGNDAAADINAYCSNTSGGLTAF